MPTSAPSGIADITVTLQGKLATGAQAVTELPGSAWPRVHGSYRACLWASEYELQQVHFLDAINEAASVLHNRQP